MAKVHTAWRRSPQKAPDRDLLLQDLGSKPEQCPSFQATRRQSLGEVPSTLPTHSWIRNCNPHQTHPIIPETALISQAFAPVAQSTQTVKLLHTLQHRVQMLLPRVRPPVSYLPIRFHRTECWSGAGLRTGPWRRKQSLFSRKNGIGCRGWGGGVG